MMNAQTSGEGNEPGAGNDQDLDTRTTGTESIIADQVDDEGAVDSPEAEAALMAGWNTAAPADLSRDDDDRPAPKNGQDTVASGAATDTGEEEDPDIPGLGKASVLRAQLARLEALEKSNSTLAGSMGHLRQQLQQAQQRGTPITREQLANVEQEFGAEFADAMARDLGALQLGGGGGASFDPAQVEEIVNARMEERTRVFEKKLVKQIHPDADDYFAVQATNAQGQPLFQRVLDEAGNEIEVPAWKRGPKNEQFMAFMAKLPADRQQELATNGWDSQVIGRALSEFKALEKKSTQQTDTQNRRFNRAAASTGSRGGGEAQPAMDPLEAGWNNVQGRQKVPSRSGR